IFCYIIIIILLIKMPVIRNKVSLNVHIDHREQDRKVGKIMSISLFLICLTITLLSSFVVGKTAYNRKQVTCMTGMMIAMTMGMIVGLTVVVVFGILFMDNFFFATILGMIVGMVIGFLAGIPVSVMAVLDGLLSGLMGGMMGAMLGAMIVPEYHEAIVKIMFFL